ncbi:MAG: hypothetical protein AAB573_01710 [Patescibacteria group bacterium]
MTEGEPPPQRSLPFYPIRGTFVRPGDYIKGTMPDGRGTFGFSGFIRSIAVWTDGVRIYLDLGTLKITAAARPFVALSQHIHKEKLSADESEGN